MNLRHSQNLVRHMGMCICLGVRVCACVHAFTSTRIGDAGIKTIYMPVQLVDDVSIAQFFFAHGFAHGPLELQ